MTLEEALEFAHSKRDRLVKNEVFFAFSSENSINNQDIFHKQYSFYRDQMTILTLNMNRCLGLIQDQLAKEKKEKK